jgi:hypothetical protein
MLEISSSNLVLIFPSGLRIEIDPADGLVQADGRNLLVQVFSKNGRLGWEADPTAVDLTLDPPEHFDWVITKLEQQKTNWTICISRNNHVIEVQARTTRHLDTIKHEVRIRGAAIKALYEGHYHIEGREGYPRSGPFAKIVPKIVSIQRRDN